ncbi:MAG: hypothetical protein R2779_06130 [Crocinitomicaceae bacterium]
MHREENGQMDIYESELKGLNWSDPKKAHFQISFQEPMKSMELTLTMVGAFILPETMPPEVQVLTSCSRKCKVKL